MEKLGRNTDKKQEWYERHIALLFSKNWSSSVTHWTQQFTFLHLVCLQNNAQALAQQTAMLSNLPTSVRAASSSLAAAAAASCASLSFASRAVRCSRMEAKRRVAALLACSAAATYISTIMFAHVCGCGSVWACMCLWCVFVLECTHLRFALHSRKKGSMRRVIFFAPKTLAHWISDKRQRKLALWLSVYMTENA
jgi:hypothetical protein